MKKPEAGWRSVLIVDDDRDTREMYCESLRALGYEPMGVASATVALDRAIQTAPAVVVTDLRLSGGIDGIELTSRLRADERTRDVRIIVLTGASLSGERERAEASGCDTFLLKPCLPHELAAEIRRVALRGLTPRGVRSAHSATPRSGPSSERRRKV